MANTHVDLSGSGSATAPYETWAKAATDIQTGLTAAGAGGACYVMRGGAFEDTATGERVLTSPGTFVSPTRLIGVLDATTNEGDSIVVADLIVRGTNTLVGYTATTTGADLNFAGVFVIHGLHFTVASDSAARIEGLAINQVSHCKFSYGGLFDLAGRYINCEFEPLGTGASFLPRDTQKKPLEVYGGVVTFTAALLDLFSSSTLTHSFFEGVDLSGGTGLRLATTHASSYPRHTYRNCILPSSYDLISGNFIHDPTEQYVEVISCSTATGAKASDSSYPDYEYQDYCGNVDVEVTAVRTGGADDGASGLFSYALTPIIDRTKESSAASIIAPQMRVWVTGGVSTTLTLYFANSGAGDYNTDDVQIRWTLPDAGDTAQHTVVFPLGYLCSSGTAHTDDAVSSWGTGAGNAQKASTTFTPGYSGWAYVSLSFAKLFASAPEILYVDPKIEVT